MCDRETVDAELRAKGTLQMLDAEHNVYPMADDIEELLTAERPKLVSGKEASYGPGTIRLPKDAVIDIKNRSFSIVAEVDNPNGKAEGVLVLGEPAAKRS